MRAQRSLLFVPGHKADWIPKALASAADAVIIDLEDAVPEGQKEVARANARDAIAGHHGPKTILIRPNGLLTPHFFEDLHATAVAGLDAYLLPMLTNRDDVVAFDAVIAAAELANGTPRGTIEVIPSFETAAAIENVAQILAGPRVGGLMAAAAKDADIARSVGFRWSPEGSETLYLRSRLVLAARAAGLRMVVLGLWQNVADIAGLRAFAEANAALGYRGQVIIHPTHAAVVNTAYGLSPELAGYYRRLVAAFDAAVAEGHGAVAFDGEHIDLAHAEHARAMLRDAGPDAADRDEPKEHP